MGRECNHWVHETLRGQGIGSWLIRSAAERLRLGGTTGLIVYTIENDLADACLGYYGRYGLRPINRTRPGMGEGVPTGQLTHACPVRQPQSEGEPT